MMSVKKLQLNNDLCRYQILQLGQNGLIQQNVQIKTNCITNTTSYNFSISYSKCITSTISNNITKSVKVEPCAVPTTAARSVPTAAPTQTFQALRSTNVAATGESKRKSAVRRQQHLDALLPRRTSDY